ncbi:acyltransferase [Arcticibacter sp.]|uniref:acyltransferase n=1 Tax=Arcticibacter sp. TaxID=1872630 RepID=UPI00388F71F1
MEEKKKFVWADSLRVAATVAVITVHASASIPPLFGQVPQSIWWTANIIDCLARFCVPVFVMLSGALLLRNYSSTAVFFRKRFLRIVFPFLFWSLIYSLLQLSVKTSRLWHMSIAEYLSFFWKQLAEDTISYHFWYIYMIMGLYILIPFIGGLVRSASDHLLLGFTGIWFLLIFCIDFLGTDTEIYDVLRYLGYLPLGYYLGKKDLNKNTRLVSLLFIVLGLLITTIGTFWLSNQRGTFDAAFYGYTSPNILLFSVGVFMLFRCSGWRLSNQAGSFINQYSYGIYLVHVLVLSQVKLPWLNSYPLIGIPLTVIFCLAASGTVILLVNKLPGGKYVSG